MQKSGPILLASILVLAVFFIYSILDPASNSIFPNCPFLSLTGFQCPGCGSQRATHQLLNGNILAAFQYNPLFVIAIPYIFVGALFGLPVFKEKYLGLQRFLFGYKTIYIILTIIILFWILRNVISIS